MLHLWDNPLDTFRVRAPVHLDAMFKRNPTVSLTMNNKIGYGSPQPT